MSLLTPDPSRAPEMSEPLGTDGVITSMDLFGDQLVLRFHGQQEGLPFDSSACCIYRASTGQIELIDPPRPQSLCLAPGGRLLYQSGDAVGSVDLLSGSRQKFSRDEGMPVEGSAMIGYGGARYAVVAEERGWVVGLFDWPLKKWLTPPHPRSPRPIRIHRKVMDSGIP
jgi:hypothetical protein